MWPAVARLRRTKIFFVRNYTGALHCPSRRTRTTTLRAVHCTTKVSRVTFVLHFLPLVLCLLSCQQTPPVLKIALAGPFEGQQRAIGYDAIYSARLAVREINQAGGIGAYRLALVSLDDGGDPALAAEVADSLALDPAVVAVIGHWLPTTTAASRPIYRGAGLPFIAAGERPFTETAPDHLPANFHTAYAAVTPFEEIAGPYAGPAYDAFYLLAAAMKQIVEQEQEINRETLSAVLQNLHYEGITGDVYQPQ